MIQYLPEFLTVASIHLLAVMSPGPDFALTVNKIQHWVERTMGAVLIALGIKVALSSSK